MNTQININAATSHDSHFFASPFDQVTGKIISLSNAIAAEALILNDYACGRLKDEVNLFGENVTAEERMEGASARIMEHKAKLDTMFC